ncbi:MaoC/PaaZ C-terminal domain-containing protein [Pseudomonas sp. BGr12]|uniref:MaoC/PaaZ C-terminal domain-containing protein n=1 Tax=Pseudomonas sp. BGr12 TaxID=2936269 RepID=UPI002559C29C|nr:MaoC/PaaZ C-terminal domain-containing protein [Pseudomonas sp. BJa5]MDL2426330.1 dehydratase [Pseudomonas sp. BJa5]
MTDRSGNSLLQNWVGKEGVSDWYVISQAAVDEYAELCGDGEGEWVHLDPVRAAQEPAFGGTIVQGFFQVAHLVRLSSQALRAQETIDMNYSLNYGFDRLRFLKPMPVGAKFRARVRAVDLSQRPKGGYVLKQEVKLELEDGTLTLVADWLFLLDPRALQQAGVRANAPA